MTEGELVTYLLDRGLLSTDCITDGSLRVVRTGGRNLTFCVRTAGGPAYLVKQYRTDNTLMQREAVVYAYLGQYGSADLHKHLPAVRRDDPDNRVLVLEHINGEDLRRVCSRGRRPPPAAARTAVVLAALHGIAPENLPADLPEPSIVESSVPVGLHRPDDRIFETFSSASVELISLIQADRELCAALDRIVEEWRPEVLIHGDVRFDNVVAVDGRSARDADVCLVDWETATVGDPCWDLGCLIAEYVHQWLESIPLAHATAAAEHASLARYPLRTAQTAIRRVWTRYTRRLGLDPATRLEQLMRTSRYVGARTLARALEISQESSTVTVRTACQAQVGAKILTAPQVAAAALLGIPCPVGDHE